MGEQKNGVANAVLDGIVLLVFFVLVAVFWWIVFFLVKLIFRSSGLPIRFIFVCVISTLFYFYLPEEYREISAIFSFLSGLVSMFVINFDN